MEKELDGCWNRIGAKFFKKRVGKKSVGQAVKEWVTQEGIRVFGSARRKERMKEVWGRWEEQCPDAFDMDELLTHKRKLEGFVICPIDKFPEEGQIL